MARRRFVRFARAVLAGCFFAGYALGSILFAGLVIPPALLFGGTSSGRRAVRACVRAVYRLFVFAGRVTGLFRVRFSAEDRAILASARGTVVVANHLTLIDVIVLLAHLGDATAVAKSAAAHNLFYAYIVRTAFLVNDDPEGVLDDAADLLAHGVNIVVFPEGTRTPADAPTHPLRRGAAQIALRAGCDILPVRLRCDPPVLAKRQPWYDVADRTITWTLEACPRIAACPATDNRHAAAARMTEEIAAALFADLISIPMEKSA